MLEALAWPGASWTPRRTSRSRRERARGSGRWSIISSRNSPRGRVLPGRRGQRHARGAVRRRARSRAAPRRDTRDELPYSIATRVTEWEWPRVRVDIVVERESQKGMVIGKGGRCSKRSVSRAREQMPEGSSSSCGSRSTRTGSAAPTGSSVSATDRPPVVVVRRARRRGPCPVAWSIRPGCRCPSGWRSSVAVRLAVGARCAGAGVRRRSGGRRLGRSATAWRLRISSEKSLNASGSPGSARPAAGGNEHREALALRDSNTHR